MSHEVFFILDDSFSGDLWSLSRSAHVWLIKSTQNEADYHRCLGEPLKQR